MSDSLDKLLCLCSYSDHFMKIGIVFEQTGRNEQPNIHKLVCMNGDFMTAFIEDCIGRSIDSYIYRKKNCALICTIRNVLVLPLNLDFS